MKIKHEINQDYYQEAKTWYQENYESLACAKNCYVISTIALSILLALSLISISIMMPLKSFVYRMISVNEQTGEVTVLKEIEGSTYQAKWNVTRYFLHQYIENRESYAFEEISKRFNQVLLMSDSLVDKNYREEIVDTNPKSPILILKNNFYKKVNVISINQLNDNTATVRFSVVTQNKDNVIDTKKDEWQAIIKWKYVNVSGSYRDLDRNPLGFKVTYYQLSPVFPENK